MTTTRAGTPPDLPAAGRFRSWSWSGLLLTAVTVVGLAFFAWPLLVPTQPGVDIQHSSAPWAVVAVLPLLVLLVVAGIADGGLDTKTLALLGVLSAVNAALRPLGAGAAGIEVVFFLLILAGRVFGATFGFLLGCVSLFASSLLTAGVGPWLPYQMLAAGWVGLGAGLLPRRVRHRAAEIAMLCGYGIVAAFVFGALMNLSFWPFAVSPGFDGQSGVAFVAGAPMLDNLHRFAVFSVLTSGVWDTGRAITNVVAIVVLGPAVLAVLRRAARRARFAAATRSGDSDRSPDSARPTPAGRRGQLNLAATARAKAAALPGESSR